MQHLKLRLFSLIIIYIFMLCCGCTPATSPSEPIPNSTPPEPTTLTVDWDMEAYVVWPSGTTTDFFPLQINGAILEAESATYLQLNIDLPDDFRYMMEIAEPNGDICAQTEVGSPGDFITGGYCYDKVENALALVSWAVNIEKGYFIAYWGEEFGQFLVATADSKADYDDVLRHFHDFIYTYCPHDPAQTIWDIDWQMYGMWIGEDGQVVENIEFSITGMAAYHPNVPNHTLADLEIRWPEGYRFYTPPMRIGVWVNANHPEGLYIDGSIAADDLQNEEIALGTYGLAPDQGLFWLYWETSGAHERLPGYLIASTDPNTSREDIETFFAPMMTDERFQ